MAQNKFWLVKGLNIEKQHKKKEEAEYTARRLAEEHASTFGVFELISSFEGKVTKTVNVTETSFEVTPEELKLIPKTEYRKKFNNGDLVKIEHSDDAFKIIACKGSFTKEYTGNVYDIESIKGGKIYRSINECDLMPKESSAVEPKFKIGDIVNINVIGFKGSRFEITYCFVYYKGKKEGYHYDIKNIENKNERSHGINEMYITLAE